MKSIRKYLLVWLLLVLTLSAVLGIWAVYSRARSQARSIFDFQLQQMAAGFPAEGFTARSNYSHAFSASPEIGDVVVQIWDNKGNRVYISNEETEVPVVIEPGFSTVYTETASWRVYRKQVGDNLIQLAQSRVVREELAKDMAMRAMLPLLGLFPILIVLVWVAVGRGLAPLNRIASEVRSSSVDELRPINVAPVPSEVMPLVAAVNELIGRLDHAMRLQRSFIADAAHELRTPITAVGLQIQIAERAQSEDARAAAFAALRGGSERVKHLVKQLLALARTEPEAFIDSPEPLYLSEFADQVVSECMAGALARRINLDLSAEPDVRINGYPDAIRILIRNLVDNAIRYTPEGGKVEVRVNGHGDRAVLGVEDNGPGIAPDDRKRVFNRFYRGVGGGIEGSGLGLAIVQRLVQRHGASIELSDGPDGRGLHVRVEFPRCLLTTPTNDSGSAFRGT